MPHTPCPSCHDPNGYSEVEATCINCGGPHWCWKCTLPIEGDDWNGWDGWDCMVCGKKFHPQCLPTNFSGDSVVCLRCMEDNSAA